MSKPMAPEKMKNMVTEFQHMMDLKETGSLNKETMEAMVSEIMIKTCREIFKS